jgi:prepilin-type N-terminal cleavage/methylation domain-containing protein/prepilin-type processing-associated H-X9-DG protein
MTTRPTESVGTERFPGHAFTLIELLVVIAILPALLFPGLAQAKATAQSTKCKSNRRQFGLALRMCVDDSYGEYPCQEKVLYYSWVNSLEPYLKVYWTNRDIQCPVYKGVLRYAGPPVPLEPWPLGSYAYNTAGTSPTGNRPSSYGLSNFRNLLERYLCGPTVPAVRKSEVTAPSEMFAFYDSRVTDRFAVGTSLGWGGTSYDIWISPGATEYQRFRHGNNYNAAYCDGHVSSVRREDLKDPRQTWRNWNRDQVAHSEGWVLPLAE